ncbi:glycoside hydrolase family 16 protein [Plicaturopsis crispa FD-325 SS-3]|nr:glycoside hydrolase family 16 protein [Plicaturopsis crispa FD-325 SS-3]
MAKTPRRVPPPSQDYYAVPQSPHSNAAMHAHQHTNSIPTTSGYMRAGSTDHQRNGVTQGVATGAIGGGYGPYSYNPAPAPGRDYNPSRFSAAPSEVSVNDNAPQASLPNTSTVPPYLWDTKDPDLDDALHNPDPRRDANLGSSFTLFSWRGWANASALVVLVAGLIILFAGYPIIAFYRSQAASVSGQNFGGFNASGQIPQLQGLRGLIDPDTDSSVHTRTGTDGKKYQLVWSDEFNTDGRTFWPGDDPYWEAADLNYWPTGDLEWYDPQAITTADGKLVITMTEQQTHNLNFQSGMLTSWNKLCFTTGYVEVSISMPGSPTAPGLWPGAWTMGNLGRAGYGATTEGTWPYSYDACDVGTYPNQTDKSGNPAAATTGGNGGAPVSFLPGQRLSSCTCSGSDHPGPKTSVGRGAPEVDIIETQIDVSKFQGQVSQSNQVAPFNYQYNFVNTTPATTIYDSSQTTWNTYKGGQYQQALSALTYIDSANYGGTGYATYGMEMWSDPSNRDDGYITWFSAGQKSWTLTSASQGPDSTVGISQRLIPEEPMYLILNLGLSPSFQAQDFKHLVFPSKMYIDYVRVYQREGVKEGVTCNPSAHPTTDYINNHINAYTNPNLTTWAQAGYKFPRNSAYDGC